MQKPTRKKISLGTSHSRKCLGEGDDCSDGSEDGLIMPGLSPTFASRTRAALPERSCAWIHPLAAGVP